MPPAPALVAEIKQVLSIYCYVEKTVKRILSEQSVSITENARLEVIDVQDALEGSGVLFGIKPPNSNRIVFMSATSFI